MVSQEQDVRARGNDASIPCLLGELLHEYLKDVIKKLKGTSTIRP